MTEIIRQCWAFNYNAQRCDMPASHPGNHSMTITWSDEECYHNSPDTPKTTVTNPGSITVPATLPQIQPEPAVEESCQACRHRHKSGPCKCGCYEYIG